MAAIDRAFHIDQIEPYVFVGSWQAGTDEQNIEDYQLKAILSLEVNKKPPNVLEGPYAKYDIHSYEIHIDNVASENIQKWFPRIFSIIYNYANQKTNILVHCSDGNGRALMGVAAYLLIKTYIQQSVKDVKRAVADDIMHYVFSKRQNPTPLMQFTLALKNFEQQIREEKYDIEALKKML